MKYDSSCYKNIPVRGLRQTRLRLSEKRQCVTEANAKSGFESLFLNLDGCRFLDIAKQYGVADSSNNMRRDKLSGDF